MRRFHITIAIGLVLILLGLVLSSDRLIPLLQGVAAPDSQPLVLGVQLFRAGLIVFGTYIMSLWFVREYRPAHDPDPVLAETTRTETALFAGLILCAVVLRLYSLDIGIWFDEMLTHVNYMPLSVGQIVSTYHDANNHVLFSVLARLSLSLFGDSVWALRLPAACFGIGSIWALYALARRVSSTRESLFAVALMVFSFHHIWFSQNARGYTALLFFSLLSSAWLLDAIRHGSPRKWMLYSLAVVLGAYTHLTMGLVALAHFAIYIACLFRNTPYRWNGLIYGFIPVGLLTFQVYALVLPSVVSGALLNSGLQGPDTEWTNPLWALMEVVNGLQVGFAGGGVALVAVAVFGVGLLDFLQTRPAVAALFLIPVLVGFTAMTSIGYTLFPRFFFFGMGFGIIILIRGAMLSGQYLSRLVRLFESWPARMGMLLCVGIVSVSLLSLRYVYLPKQNYAGAIDLIERERQEGDRIVTIGIAGFPFNAYYEKGWENVKTLNELDTLARGTGRTWLIYTMPVHAKTAYPGLMGRIEQEYTVVKKFWGSLNGGAVVVCLENQVPAT